MEVTTLAERKQHAGALLPLERGATGGSRIGRVLRKAITVAGRLLPASLEIRFVLFSVVVLVAGALTIGGWTSREISGRVMERAAATNALYVDSLISPLVQPLDERAELPQANSAALDRLLGDTALGEKIVSFKIWSPTGEILYATNDQLVGTEFPITAALRNAAEGDVAAHVSGLDDAENEYEKQRWDRLLETYAPVRSHRTGKVIAVSEFYQEPSDVLGAVRASQNRAWMIVGVATAVMFVVLNGMVRGASATIRGQNERLQRLNRQVRAASASQVQTEEQVMSRIAQDIHDAPAQSLAVALMRLRSETEYTSVGHSRDWDLIRDSVEGALDDLRSISSGIRIPDLDDLDANAVVSRAAAEFSRKTGRPVSCRPRASQARLSPAARATTYRIIQEALNNSFLHAGAASQRVSASLVDGWLELEVTDDGIGFDLAEVNDRVRGDRVRLGIRGMRERAELLGGTFEIEATPGAGTRVFARIPTEESVVP